MNYIHDILIGYYNQNTFYIQIVKCIKNKKDLIKILKKVAYYFDNNNIINNNNNNLNKYYIK